MNDWWTSFFAGNWLDVQRTAYSDAETATETELIRTLLALEPGMKVLDVPCGMGRISIPLALGGVHVTGVDQSAEILDVARESARQLGVELDLRHADMRDLPWEAEFDAALCWWGSFGYLDDEGDEDFVRAVAKSLKPGGRFMIDAHIAESLYPKFQPRGWKQCGDILILEERSIDIERGSIDVEWRIYVDGRWESRRSSIRLYTYRELRDLILRSGFSSVEAFAGRTMEAFRFGSGRLVMVAQR